MRRVLSFERLNRSNAGVDGIAVICTAAPIQTHGAVFAGFQLGRPRPEIIAPAVELGLLVQMAIHQHRLRTVVLMSGHLEKQHGRARFALRIVQADQLQREPGHFLRLHPISGLPQYGLNMTVGKPVAVKTGRFARNGDVVADALSNIGVPCGGGMGQDISRIQYGGRDAGIHGAFLLAASLRRFLEGRCAQTLDPVHKTTTKSEHHQSHDAARGRVFGWLNRRNHLFVTMQHRFDQIFFFLVEIKQNGGNMQDDQGGNHPFAHILVPPVGQTHAGVGDKACQRALVGDFIVTDQAGADLRGQKCQQRKHRASAQRVVPSRVFGFALAFQISDHRAGGINEGAKARPLSTDQTPDDPEKQQSHHAVTQAEMPGHQITANIAGDDQAYHANEKSPVEDARG